MNSNVFIVDREDQVRWYVNKDEAANYCVQLDGNHKYLRDWLVEMTKGHVVVSGQGTMPRSGTTDHPSHNVYAMIQRNQYKVWFEDEQDAVAFKLAWGGSL